MLIMTISIAVTSSCQEIRVSTENNSIFQVDFQIFWIHKWLHALDKLFKYFISVFWLSWLCELLKIIVTMTGEEFYHLARCVLSDTSGLKIRMCIPEKKLLRNTFPLQKLKQVKEKKQDRNRAIYSSTTASLINLLKWLTVSHKGTSFTGAQAPVKVYCALGCLGHLQCWLDICVGKLWASFEASLWVYQSLYLLTMLC